MPPVATPIRKPGAPKGSPKGGGFAGKRIAGVKAPVVLVGLAVAIAIGLYIRSRAASAATSTAAPAAADTGAGSSGGASGSAASDPATGLADAIWGLTGLLGGGQFDAPASSGSSGLAGATTTNNYYSALASPTTTTAPTFQLGSAPLFPVAPSQAAAYHSSTPYSYLNPDGSWSNFEGALPTPDPSPLLTIGGGLDPAVATAIAAKQAASYDTSRTLQAVIPTPPATMATAIQPLAPGVPPSKLPTPGTRSIAA